MKVSLRKFFEAYEGTPHQIAAVEILADEMPDELLEKFSFWVETFEAHKEVDPLPEHQVHKGYTIKIPWH